ncbi:aspartate/glutamate racemase family protein [uncultured Roseobacter sp.]|uniref:aspartate/glutamate racemase family protein n=1 Tax=uncultured Roseobacter sp. TaxID=114847 RepID=UPI00260C3A42|nr:aspartate/glutamate racemase family protein [uncultured Roseobacter sp.]
MTTATTRIALIHATRLAIDPVEEAAKRLWPEAEMVSLLDESLEVDRERAGSLTPALADRIMALARHAQSFGTCGILFTCSAFGEAVEAADAALNIPVMKPNEAMFADALLHGDKIAMIYTFPPAAAGMEAEFRALVSARGASATIESHLCDGALTAKQAGDAETHDRLIAECGALLKDYDAILLAQFSMASAAACLSQRTEASVLTSPQSAILEMRRRVESGTRSC